MAAISLLLDSRQRVSGSLSDFIIDIPASVDIKRLSLVYADITTPLGWALPAFVIDIEGVNGLLYTRGGSGSGALQGFGSFVVPTAPAPGINAIFREETDFVQSVTLNPPQRFARMRVRTLGSDGALAGLTDESLLILRVG
jgi:hypothetical protein